MIEPLNGKVFIIPEKVAERTKSGIYLTQDAEKRAPEIGKISHVSLGVETLKVGDRVIFKRFSPDEIEVAGTTYLVCDESDILAICANEDSATSPSLRTPKKRRSSGAKSAGRK